MRPLNADDRTRATSQSAEAFIKPNDRLTSLERLEIYNRQYWFRVLDCLYDDYPGLRAALGGTKFQRLAKAYLERYPSSSFTLRNLGQHLVQFIRDEPRWTQPHQLLALDMVQVEWAQIVAFDGEAKRPVNFKQLAGREPDQIYLQLQPYISLLELVHPVDEVVVRILRDDDKMRSEASNAVELESRISRRGIARQIKRGKTRLLVHRLDYEVYFKRLEPAQFRLLQALQSGASLADACGLLKKTSPEKLGAWFETWAALRWFWVSKR